MKWKRVKYTELKAKQKENFNYQKVSAVLADYGFVTSRLSDDWQGADFLAIHIDIKVPILRVQLKSRLTFEEPYRGKDLYVVFADAESKAWYFYPHDELLNTVLDSKNMGSSSSWQNDKKYSYSKLSASLRKLLEPYVIAGGTEPVPE